MNLLGTQRYILSQESSGNVTMASNIALAYSNSQSYFSEITPVMILEANTVEWVFLH